jgi:CysZ protein
MIRALVLAFGQLGDRRIQRAILWTLVLALAVAAVLIAAASGVFALLEVTGITFIDWALAIFGGLAAAFVAWLLFPVLAAEFLYMFVDGVADAVEARHYPNLPPGRPASWWQYTKAGIRLALVMAFFNLLILPLSFVPVAQVFYPFFYFIINGVLLGREFFEIVAPRHMDFAEVRNLRRKHRIKIFVSGLVIALLFIIPLVNLIAPIVATAFMVHVFHGMRGSGNRPGL